MFRRLVAGALGLLLVGCSEGPEPPKPGTPAFYWNAVKENYGKADYAKAVDQLGRLMNSENEFTARARPMNLVLLAGMTKGYMELADSFEYGTKANKANPTPFRKYMMNYRSLAQQTALQFAEDFGKFTKVQTDAEIPLGFPAPSGTAGRPPLLDKVASGVQSAVGQADDLQRDVIRRSIVLAVCEAAGTPNDVAKATELLKGESAKVSRGVFMKAMADAFYEQAGLFGNKKLGLPDRQKFMLTQATEALKGVAESKESKDLKKKIDGDLKGL